MRCTIALFFSMYKNVERVSPGAQVARKLAITLVDTARVLEVLVAIVLVGKHLSTSLTLIPGTACIQTQLPFSVQCKCVLT